MELAKIPEEERVYVDETGVNQFLQRERGRAFRGKKVLDVRPGRRFKRQNIVGGMCGGRLLATLHYEHSTTATFFEYWFEEVLLPQIPRGYTVIMDNASFHRKKMLQNIACKSGINLLFLPPYSPDFNPIEHCWANMKRWLRNIMSQHYDAAWCINEYLWWQYFQDY